MDVAEWEASRIWPGGPSPDVVISLGTGIPPTPDSPKDKFESLPSLSSRFAPRLYRSFMSSKKDKKIKPAVFMDDKFYDFFSGEAVYFSLV